ncbi:ubiquitin-protein transferase activating protein [Mortierella polycephala]|uniref:Ubiquitin-protein transferase activating protein n=1 Tax=Mortierella polycephala TaxID=41804 RepID=A0A9P6PSE4_9FUNG|nr:ubiquitin-protein transferase activating protein [Mortierella polycephala]
MSYNSPERKQATALITPVTPHKLPAPIRSVPSTPTLSPNKRLQKMNVLTGGSTLVASPKKSTSSENTGATAGGVSVGASYKAKENARYARQLQSLSAGFKLGTPRSGRFLNSSASASKFSASATAVATPVLKDSNRDNISNNQNANRSDSTDLNTKNKTTIATPGPLATSPKSVLGKRSSVIAGLVPTTPSTAAASPSLFVMKTPQPSQKLQSSPTRTPFTTPQSNRATAGSLMSTKPLSTVSTAKIRSVLSPKRPTARTFERVATTGVLGTKTQPAQLDAILRRSLSSQELKSKLEVVTNDWVGGNMPKKNRKVAYQGDRFIPSRGATNMANMQAKLQLARSDSKDSLRRHPSSSSVVGNQEPTDEEGIIYEQMIAAACGVDLTSRMLSFNPNVSKVETLASQATRAMLSRHPSLTRLNSSSSLIIKKRTIPTSPEKVLDAPGLADDYYLNLLDWSCSNIVAIGLDKTVFLWDAETGNAEPLVTLPGRIDTITSVSWASDGSFLAVGTNEGDTQIWDIETKTKIRSMAGHVSRVSVLSWDKHILSSGCRDGSIWNHDVRVQNHKVAELLNHTNEVCGLTWKSDGQQLASGGNDNLVNIWDARTTVPKFTKPNHLAAVKALAWCPWQNNLLASGGGTHDKQIHFWNTTTGARVQTLMTASQVTSIVWSTEYREFMSSHGFPDNNLTVYGYPSMNKIADIKAHDSRVLHTAISPDGQTVATVASDENLKFWKLFEKQKKPKGKGNTGESFTGLGKGLLGYDDDDYNSPGSGSGSNRSYMGKSLANLTRIR